MVTLDAFLRRVGDPAVTFLKSDTEGGELRVLRGAKRLLASARPPACLIEMNSRYGLDPREIVDIFTLLPQGLYSCWRVDSASGNLLPPEFGSDICNALFVPEWLRPRLTTSGLPKGPQQAIAVYCT